MKKLLLLTVIPVSAFLFSSAKNIQQTESFLASGKDSTIKGVAVTDPKAGFKNLFETSNATSAFKAKLNPQAISFVQDYMRSHANKLNDMKSWGRPYFDMMNDVLKKHGLPVELKYLSVIESHLKSFAVSWAGAVGPWQFMEGTARAMGLRVNRYTDERTDFYKSTHAAARYLNQLYNIYGDWLLVIAAYNGGPGNVNSAIRRSGSRNFWSLQNYLPTESKNHVKKFIATHYIFEGEGGLTTSTKKEAENLLLQTAVDAATVADEDTEVVSISGKYNSLVIAQNLKMDIFQFNKLNPNFDKTISMNGSYHLRLPADKVILFQASKPAIMEQSIRLLLESANRL